MQTDFMRGLTKAEQHFELHESPMVLCLNLNSYKKLGLDSDGKKLTNDYTDGYASYIETVKDI